MRLAGSEADRMRAFVRFMAPLYGEDSLARSLAEAACASEARGRTRFIEGFRELLSQNLPEGIRQRILEATPSAFLDLPEVQEFFPMRCLSPGESPAVKGHLAELPSTYADKALELLKKVSKIQTATLANVYGLAGRWDAAFEQIRPLMDADTFVDQHLDDMLLFFIDAAADGQVERALSELSGTAAERAMEPLVAALKELVGETYRAPREVEEVKKDVLARIKERRQTLSDLRGRLRQADSAPT